MSGYDCLKLLLQPFKKNLLHIRNIIFVIVFVTLLLVESQRAIFSKFVCGFLGKSVSKNLIYHLTMTKTTQVKSLALPNWI